MSKIIIIALVLGVIFILLVVLKKVLGAKGGGKNDVYYLKKTLFSPAERSFLGVLDSTLPEGVRVFGKVRLEDFIGVKRGLERGDNQAARNRINRKHVDFLLVRADTLAPVAGVELDDKSHEEADRQSRDEFVNSVFASAGLPLLHIPAQKAYNRAEIAAEVARALSSGVSRPPEELDA